MIRRQDLIIPVHHCLVEIGMSDIPVVDKEELFTIGFPGMFRFPDKTTDFDNGSLRFNGQQVGIACLSKDSYNTLTKIAW